MRRTALATIGILMIMWWVQVQLAAQEHTVYGARHHHYKLIDIGTFGGPQSSIVDQGVPGGVYVNNGGVFTGYADTRKSDPFHNFCFLDCDVDHAFQWRAGVITNLGVLHHGLSSAPTAISANGLIAGFAQNGEIDPLFPGFPELRAVLWQNGGITNLGTLPEGGYESLANSVNSRGQVVGFALNTIPDPNSLTLTLNNVAGSTQVRAFFWEDGAMQDLGTLGGPDAVALLINERGQAMGWSYTSTTQTSPCPSFPLAIGSFIWEKETGMRDLGSLGGGTCTLASDLNNRGQIVGYAVRGENFSRAFAWDHGSIRELSGSIGGDCTGAFVLNDAGEAAGFGCVKGNFFHATFWSKAGQIKDLGTVGGDPCSSAKGINARGQVVGDSISLVSCSSNLEATRAFLWEDNAIVDLNALIPPNSPLYLVHPQTINDHGEIAGFGTDASGNQHAFLLIPCDENHLTVEGCDYSMAETRLTAPLQSTVHVTPGRILPTALWQRRNRLLTLASRSPSETTVTVSPTSLVFSTQALGTASLGKKVTLENTGTTTLTISSIAIIGTNASDFFISATTCGTSLAAGASCTVKVKFKPREPGTRSAVLRFTDNAPDSPQKVTLSGIGTTAKLDPARVNFGSVTIGTTSSPATVTLTNVGMSTLTITGIAIRGTDAGDFAQTNDCGASLAAGASCSISVTFKPTLAGTRTAALRVSDNGGGSPQSVSLKGYGVGSCKRYGYTCDPNIPHQCCSDLQCVFTGGPFYRWRCE